MKKDVVYHQECSCLFSNGVEEDECLKRYYTVVDVENCTTKTIAICNETIRLKIAQKKAEYLIKDKAVIYYINNRVLLVESIIEDIISKYVCTTSITPVNDNDIFNRVISVKICERPYMYRYIPMKDAMEMSMNYNHYVSESVIRELKSYLSNHLYKKYKTKYKKALSLINRLNRCYGEQKELVMNEILLSILEMNIKLKK